MQILSFFFTLIIIAYLLAMCLRYVFPRVAMWLLRRQMRKQAKQAFGQDFDPFNPFGFGGPEQQQRNERRQRSRRRAYGKIIGKDVGEYIDFEELPGAPEPRFSPSSFVPQPQVVDVDWVDL